MTISISGSQPPSWGKQDPPPSSSPSGMHQFYGMSGLYWFYTANAMLLAAISTGLLVAGLVKAHGTAPFVTGVILSFFTIPYLALMASVAIRPLSIGDGILRVPVVFRHVDVPLSRVAGVGLIFSYAPGTQSPAGWALRVWDGDKPIQMGRWLVAAWSNPHDPRRRWRLTLKRDWSLPLAHEDSTYLAASKPGRVARCIYDAALLWQGPNGPLRSQAHEKEIVYDPNAMVHLAAWWSPDGSMGRAKGLPPVDSSKTQLAEVIRVPRSRRLWGVAVAVGGFIASLALAGVITAIDNAYTASPATGTQKLILALGIGAMIIGTVVSLFFAALLWRYPKRRRPPRADGGSPPEVGEAAAEPSITQPQTLAPAPIPQPNREVRQARRLVYVLNYSSVPLWIAAWVVTSLMLHHVGHLAKGETCTPVLGHSLHPSVACNAWRHHQLMTFLLPGALLAIAIVALFVAQGRALSAQIRLSRRATAESGHGRPLPLSPR